MDNNEIEMFFDPNSQGECYIESLVRSWKILDDSASCPLVMIDKMVEVISLELDLAIMGAQKAKSEVLKSQIKDNLRPIK